MFPAVLAIALLGSCVSMASALQAPSQPNAPAQASQSSARQSGAQATPEQAPEAPAPQSAAQQQNNTGKAPVGTAAAPYEPTVGVAASRPAGAAMAPAKQKRVRRIFIRVGLLVGAAVAIGTVIALSRTSSGRP